MTEGEVFCKKEGENRGDENKTQEKSLLDVEKGAERGEFFKGNGIFKMGMVQNIIQKPGTCGVQEGGEKADDENQKRFFE